MDNWNRWTERLGDRVEQTKNLDMSEDTVATFAKIVGDYLAEHADPKNDQDRVLKDLWMAADEPERLVLARLIMKMLISDSVRARRSM